MVDHSHDATVDPAPRRPGHRGADMRDTVAELTERAQLISQEAGTRVALAMKDVIGAAAGLSGFSIESARDLLLFMVRRGQMTAEESEKLLREAEQAHAKRPDHEKNRPTATKVASDRAAQVKADNAARAAAAAAAMPAAPSRPMETHRVKPVATAAEKAPAKAAKPPAKAAAKKPAAKKAATPKAAAPKASAKTTKPAKKKR